MIDLDEQTVPPPADRPEWMRYAEGLVKMIETELGGQALMQIYVARVPDKKLRELSVALDVPIQPASLVRIPFPRIQIAYESGVRILVVGSRAKINVTRVVDDPFPPAALMHMHVPTETP